jgi:hypothetical protein
MLTFSFHCPCWFRLGTPPSPRALFDQIEHSPTVSTFTLTMEAACISETLGTLLTFTRCNDSRAESTSAIYMTIILDIVHRRGFFQTQRFGHWICFRHQVYGRKLSYSDVPLERTSLAHWTRTQLNTLSPLEPVTEIDPVFETLYLENNSRRWTLSIFIRIFIVLEFWKQWVKYWLPEL